MNQLVVQILGWVFVVGILFWAGLEMRSPTVEKGDNEPFRRKGKDKEDEEDVQE